MKQIVIIGAGGFGREVQWLLERINAVSNQWEVIGYIDDNKETGEIINDIPVLGDIDHLLSYKKSVSAVCGIASPDIRKKIISKLRTNSYIDFPAIVDPAAVVSDTINIGKGSIICAGNIFTVNIDIADFVIINLSCTVGHNVRINSFATVYPGVNISGNVFIGEECEIGTGSRIIQGISIPDNVVIGAGSAVFWDIEEAGTYVGVPVRKIMHYIGNES